MCFHTNNLIKFLLLVYLLLKVKSSGVENLNNCNFIQKFYSKEALINRDRDNRLRVTYRLRS
jgi:hypothetical protein